MRERAEFAHQTSDFCNRGVRAAGHDRQRSSLRGAGTARHRRIDEIHAPRRKCRGDAMRRLELGRRDVDTCLAVEVSCRGKAARPGRSVFNRRRIDDADNDDARRLGHRRRARCRLDAPAGRHLHLRRIDIEADDVVTHLDQTMREALAHQAEADKSDRAHA